MPFTLSSILYRLSIVIEHFDFSANLCIGLPSKAKEGVRSYHCAIAFVVCRQVSAILDLVPQIK